MEELLQQLKKDIVEGLKLEDRQIEDISDDMPLFEGGLQLDSLDALELVFIMDKKYDVKVTNQEDAMQIFVSVRTMAEFIMANKK